MNKYGLFTIFKTQSGKREAFTAILLQAAAAMSDIKGLHHYIVCNDQQDENTVCVSEIWDTKEDHDDSLKIAGTMELIMKALPLLDGKPESRQLEVLEGIKA